MNTSMFDSGGNSTATATAMRIEIPQWLIDAHHFRKRLFLRTVEPIIVFLLGPVVVDNGNDDRAATTDETSTNYYSTNASSESFIASPLLYSSHPHRRLSFLPSWVENPNYSSNHTSMSMSFATLTMMYIIMSVILLVFLSCFYHNQKTSPLLVSPRRHRLPKLVPPPLPVDGAFSWMKVCLLMSDEEVRGFFCNFHDVQEFLCGDVYLLTRPYHHICLCLFIFCRSSIEWDSTRSSSYAFTVLHCDAS